LLLGERENLLQKCLHKRAILLVPTLEVGLRDVSGNGLGTLDPCGECRGLGGAEFRQTPDLLTFGGSRRLGFGHLALLENKRKVGSQESVDLGLLNRLVEPGDLLHRSGLETGLLLLERLEK
jgi:hypothetical protein